LAGKSGSLPGAGGCSFIENALVADAQSKTGYRDGCADFIQVETDQARDIVGVDQKVIDLALAQV
jgi:hypothetical protein